MAPSRNLISGVCSAMSFDMTMSVIYLGSGTGRRHPLNRRYRIIAPASKAVSLPH